MRELLEFNWPLGSGTFSFDLGGRLRGGPLDNKMFVAEIKNYRNESDLPEHYRLFLARCYVAFKAKPTRCDYFMWISWSPFQARRWDRHRTAEFVREAVISHRAVIFGDCDPESAQRNVDYGAIVEVASRIWLITLCDQQEELVVTPEHQGEVLKLWFGSEKGIVP
jgi:hypothetical protein